MLRKSLTALALTLVAPLAFAHASLTSSQPADGAELATAPTELVFDFSEGVETSLSQVTLEDDAGQPIEIGALTADASGTHRYRIELPELAPGKYSVEVKVTSVDTHRIEDSLEFTVQPD
ncbi:copper resistance CopC family protein [Halotalea alkalilenta]|uniref:copper resistance CopC family protein n=1 Tax=Halotalea alkalilenta TaxID=376489 RepID=UPI000484CD0F|nr:copper resistance protein CopC [Halotalea alkalilenta]